VDEKGLVLLLAGELGTGKTEFAKGLAEGLGLSASSLVSPSFVIASEQPLPRAAGRPRRLVHADLYRVRAEEELEMAGLHDWLAPGTLLAVEWGDRYPQAFPRERLEVDLARAPSGYRTLRAEAHGRYPEEVLRRWRATCP